MVLTDLELEELEKKYFLILFDILLNNHEYIIERLNSKDNTKRYWINKLKEDIRKQPIIKNGTERITESIIARNVDWEVSAIPVGSDLCYENKEAIIHIDDKSLFNSDIDVKNKRVAVRENQVSYKQSNKIAGKRGKRKGTSMEFEPALPKYYENRACLTYFIQFVYDKEKDKTIKIILWCVPNGQLSKYYDDIYEAPKSWPGGPRVIKERIENSKLIKDWKRVEEIQFNSQNQIILE